MKGGRRNISINMETCLLIKKTTSLLLLSQTLYHDSQGCCKYTCRDNCTNITKHMYTIFTISQNQLNDDNNHREDSQIQSENKLCSANLCSFDKSEDELDENKYQPFTENWSFWWKGGEIPWPFLGHMHSRRQCTMFQWCSQLNLYWWGNIPSSWGGHNIAKAWHWRVLPHKALIGTLPLIFSCKSGNM